MKNTALFIVIVLLIISMVGNYIQYDISRDKEIGSRAAETIRIAERNHDLNEIRLRDRHIQATLSERDSVVKISTVMEARLSSQIKALKSRLIPVTVINRADTAELFAGVVRRDSVIHSQDSLVLTLATEKAELLRTDSIAFDSLKSNVMQFKDLFEKEAKETVKLETLLENEKGRHWSLGVMIGPQVGTGTKPVYAGFGVTIGISYKIRFK